MNHNYGFKNSKDQTRLCNINWELDVDRTSGEMHKKV